MSKANPARSRKTNWSAWNKDWEKTVASAEARLLLAPIRRVTRLLARA